MQSWTLSPSWFWLRRVYTFSWTPRHEFEWVLRYLPTWIWLTGTWWFSSWCRGAHQRRGNLFFNQNLHALEYRTYIDLFLFSDHVIYWSAFSADLLFYTHFSSSNLRIKAGILTGEVHVWWCREPASRLGTEAWSRPLYFANGLQPKDIHIHALVLVCKWRHLAPFIFN